MRTFGIALLLVFCGVSCTPKETEGGSEGGAEGKQPAAAGQAQGEAGSEKGGDTKGEGDWKVIFDGKTMDGWKANENKDSWSLKDGVLVANGPRSHLFYVGDKEPFVDFELEAVIMTKANSNSGVYIHTQYQDEGWPKHGYEVQVNNSHGDPQKTGGLYGVAKVLEAPAKDDAWFTMKIRVQGKQIVVEVDGKKVTDYTEPPDKEPGKDFTRILSKGTFGLQAHDPESTVSYKSIRVRRL
jgi:hypothetical protein